MIFRVSRLTSRLSQHGFTSYMSLRPPLYFIHCSFTRDQPGARGALWDRSMRLVRPPRRLITADSHPRSQPPSLSQSKTSSRGRPIDPSLGDRQCLHNLGCPDCIHHLRETPRTVRVSLKAIGRIDAMCLSIGLLRDPTCIIRRSSDLVSNESAKTTDREQWRLFPRSGPGCMGYLTEQGINRA